MKVKYLGTSPGQSEKITIGGFRFERGKTTDLTASDIQRLGLQEKGGFEIAGKKSEDDKNIYEELGVDVPPEENE